MSLLDRLRRLVGRPALIVPEGVEIGPPAPPAPPDERAAAEAGLAALVQKLVAGDPEASPAAAAAHIDALEADGHPRLAAEWLDKVTTAARPSPARDRMRARAAELYLGRGETEAALPHLEALAPTAEHGARAHSLLGEHHARQGDKRRALRHYEAVLARDLAYPNARARADTLRTALGAQARPAAVPAVTFAGVEGQAVTAGSRYRLLAEIGRGATGAVYRARDVDLEREVAVKLLHAHVGGRGTLARCFDEARVAAALRHPGIVAVLDLDEDHRRIVMELLTGGTLRDRLAGGRLPPAEALRRHAEILAALAAAHRREIVHRDLKPANLLFRRDPSLPTEIVLVDFGAAHLGAAPAAKREAIGTLRYMAPEQRRGEVTPAVDVFAAGIILYEMLAGRPATTLAERLPAAGLSLPAELGVDAAVARHVAQLTRADAAARPTSTAALAEARALS